MSDETRDSGNQLTPTAMQEMVEKAIESTMSSFSGRMMKAMDEKLNEALTLSHNPTNSGRTDATPPMQPPSSGTGMSPYTNSGVSLPDGGGH